MCASMTSSARPRKRSNLSVVNLRIGSVISIWRPVISTFIDPPDRSVFSGSETTLVSTRNLQILPVLCDTAARHGDPFLFEHVRDLFIRQRISGVFHFDEFLDFAFDDQKRSSITHRTVHRFREEKSQFKYALRSMGKLVCNGTADGRRVDADFFRNVLDHHRLEIVDSLIEEIALPANDSLANLDDDVLPLLDILQKLNRRFEAIL